MMDFDCKECKCVSCCGLRDELETLKAKVREFQTALEPALLGRSPISSKVYEIQVELRELCK